MHKMSMSQKGKESEGKKRNKRAGKLVNHKSQTENISIFCISSMLSKSGVTFLKSEMSRHLQQGSFEEKMGS